MIKKDNFEPNNMTGILTNWIQQQEWQVAIQLEEKYENATFRTRITINDQPHEMYFETDEANCWLSVYLYGATKVPTARMGEMTRLLNRINLRLTIGRLACVDDNESNPVQYRARIILNGATLDAQQIDTLALAAWRIFSIYGPIISRVALTKTSTKECWAELLKEEAAAKKTN